MDEQRVFPLKGALDVKARQAGSMVMLCEAIKAGTTTMVDSNEEMLFFAGNHVKIGIRAQLSHTVHACLWKRLRSRMVRSILWMKRWNRNLWKIAES